MTAGAKLRRLTASQSPCPEGQDRRRRRRESAGHRPRAARCGMPGRPVL